MNSALSQLSDISTNTLTTLSTQKVRDAQASEQGFFDTLKSAVDQLQSVQQESDQAVMGVIKGTEDVHGAAIAVEKANLAFQLAVQVRNKVVNAYQEISKLQF